MHTCISSAFLSRKEQILNALEEIYEEKTSTSCPFPREIFQKALLINTNACEWLNVKLKTNNTQNLETGESYGFSGSNPPYFTKECAELFKEMKVTHLLTDLPSGFISCAPNIA